MKLQKLVYIAHGWHLAVTGKPLLCDPVEAWPYGPVIPTLYHRLKHFGTDPISGHVTWWDHGQRRYVVPSETFPPDTQAVIDSVWNAYKALTAYQLSAMTHREGTPWYVVRTSAPPYVVRDTTIPDRLIQAHYVELGRAREHGA